jgi:hypothetical protein
VYADGYKTEIHHRTWTMQPTLYQPIVRRLVEQVQDPSSLHKTLQLTFSETIFYQSLIVLSRNSEKILYITTTVIQTLSFTYRVIITLLL